MSRTRDQVTLHPSVLQAADDVAKLARRKPRRNGQAAADVARQMLQAQRIPWEVIEAARELAQGDIGRIELCPWDDSVIVHNSREQRQHWHKQHQAERRQGTTTTEEG